MSSNAVTWAFGIQGIKSSLKFVLVALADNADAADCAWPSVQTIVEKTCLDRKTVLKALDCLEKAGLIEDSGRRKGATKQIKIYHLRLDASCPAVPEDTVPELSANSPENGTVEQSQKRNSPKNGTVPDFPSKSPKFPRKESQISVERVPNLGHGTIKEPLLNHQEPKREVRGTRLPPDWVPSQSDVQYCLEKRPDLDVNEVFESFRDYWQAKAGKDAVKLDWHATWRNWVRNERTRPKRRQSLNERWADYFASKAKESHVVDGTVREVADGRVAG